MKLFLALLSALAVSAQEHRATVNLNDPKGVTNVHGSVTLIQDGEGNVLVTGTVRGLTPGNHGFHVHQYGDISGGCADAGGHFNPFNKNHGGPRDTERHVGDLGNIEAGQDGVSTFSITDSVISLTGDNSIVGKSIVVHSGEDDLGKGGFADSLTTGHAGSRLACGVIV